MAISLKTTTYKNSWTAKLESLTQAETIGMSLRISALLFNDRNEGAVTVKVKAELSVLKHHTMKTCWGAEVKLHTLQTSSLVQGKQSASLSGHFTTGERTSGNPSG
jgi:hypothetical protein